MALTTAQQASKLFKKLMGVTESSVSREYFEEAIQARQFILPTQVWKEASSIPNTAFKTLAAAADGEASGVVTVRKGKTLTQISGTPNAFYHADLRNAIPFNYGDGTSYLYSLTSSTDASIAFGQGEWLVDTDAGTITFYGTTPANMPPKMSWYQYTGEVGVGATTTSGSMNYKGTLDASTLGAQLDNAKKGDMYKVSVAGTILTTLELKIGDMVVINKNVTGTPVVADVDKIDNTIQTERERTLDLVFGSESSLTAGAALPSNAVINRVTVMVGTAFDGTGVALAVGTGGDLMAVGEIDLGRTGTYVSDGHSEAYAGLQIPVSYTSGSSTVGSAKILIDFAVK